MTETTVAKPAGAAPAASPDAILQLGFGFWGSKTLLSAVELGVFTALAGTSADPVSTGERERKREVRQAGPKWGGRELSGRPIFFCERC